VIVIIFWILSGWVQYAAFEARYNRDSQWTLPWNEIVSALDGQTTADDLIVVQAAGGRSWWDYAQIAGYYTVELPAAVTLTPLRPYEDEAAFRAQWENEQYHDEARIFSVYDKTQSANSLSLFEDVLGERFVFCGVVADTATVHIDLFARDEDACH